ncbi:hypothetical protein PpBr36_08302 [Pyricularia pennisetigena]|uniref:hypothetical protein n=1 Tax=Pyricularia pennisetigena TaxID=1578925 RepID=UPI00114DE3E6|nr:hypothetical protein PpBr36_08302 [Pyricularia pennisetigena]TLS24084.1 hypothetical protein PpBr36_08302 [Pyricularia pennisetigena]
MGIVGLLPLLKSIQRPTELKKFAGETLAVDAYGWLHRGAVSCALELAQGKPTRKYVDFAMHRVKMVKYFGATPYIVFDGDFLPSKALTEASRAKRREESRKAGMELLKAGKPAQAYLEFQKAIDVTPEMARHLIEELKKIDVPYVVAPYEADAQMVYLERNGYVSGIISEDSDLLVFGAKRLLTKLDQHGQCIEVNRREFCAVREISLTGWTDAEFRQMAIFSGCDYLEGINKMGLKTAYRMIRKHKTPEKVIRQLQFEGKHKISENYLAAFKQAELTFMHQRVFCPEKQELVLLTEPTSGLDVDEMPFIGARVDPELARAIACGDVNPITKERIILPTPVSTKVHSFPTKRTAPAPSKPLGKPIEEFFKGHRRIPMGEMDANCFSVDPQQVGVLTANGLAPRVFPLPRPYLDETINPVHRPYTSSAGPRINRRRTEPIGNLLGLSSSDQANRRRTSGPIRSSKDESRTAGFSTSPRPQKRARLCSEQHQSTKEDKELFAEKSKFFSSTITKTPKSKRRSEGHIMSDDSIDDALLSLPDYGSLSSAHSTQPRKSMDVFMDARSDDVTSETPEVMLATPMKEDDRNKDTTEIEVPASSPIRESISTEADVDFDLADQARQSSAKLGAALGRFAYTPSVKNPANGTKMAYGLPTPDSSGVPAAIAPRSTADKKRDTTGSMETPRLTPLQRIHASAMQRQSPSASQGNIGAQTQKKRGPRRSLPPTAPVNPSFVPLPKVDLAEVAALSRGGGGSEDLLVPNSDGENEPESPKVATSRTMDLARFLCR